MVHDQLIPSIDDKVYILKEVAIDKPLFAFGNREIRHSKRRFFGCLVIPKRLVINVTVRLTERGCVCVIVLNKGLHSNAPFILIIAITVARCCLLRSSFEGMFILIVCERDTNTQRLSHNFNGFELYRNGCLIP